MACRRAWLAGVALVLSFAPASGSANRGQHGRVDPSPLDPGSPGRGPPGGLPPPRDGLLPEPGDEEPGPLPLFPRLPLGRAAGWIFPPEPRPDDREGEAEAALEQYFDEELGRDRLEAGDVDGWYRELGRSMRQRFAPDRQAVESERHRGMTLIQRVVDELRRHARPPEAPQDVPGQTLPEQRAAVTDPTDRRQAADQEWWDRCNPLNSPVTWYRVDLRVTHNPEGELSAAWVLRSSGIDALDDAALEAARSGSVTLLAPPAPVVGERQAIRSDWSFEMGDVATPIGCATESGAVVPVSCVDDPIHGTMCAVAGRGIIRTRVTLLAVVDAAHLTAEERRAECVDPCTAPRERAR